MGWLYGWFIKKILSIMINDWDWQMQIKKFPPKLLRGNPSPNVNCLIDGLPVDGICL